MRIKLMRFLDRYVGKLLISTFVVFDFFAKFLTPKSKKKIAIKAPKFILVSKYFGFGSIMNSLPLLDVLNNHYADSRIIFMTFNENREFFEITNVADIVITIRNDNFINFILDSVKACIQLQKTGIDISVDLEFFSKFSMIMSYLSGAKVRVGFFSYFNIRSALLTHPTAFNHYKHISRAYLSMAEAIGLKVPESEYSISLKRQGKSVRAELRDIIGTNNQLPIITINTNASRLCEIRKWPAENFIELIDRLMRRYSDFIFVLIGSKSEFEYVSSIYRRCGHNDSRLKNIAGKTNLRQLLALLEKTELLISNDSGPVHLAGGYKTNTIALFGPETPVLYNPINENAKVLFKNCYCSPCINVLDNKSFEECTDIKCLRNISVDEVFEIADSFLNKRI